MENNIPILVGYFIEQSHYSDCMVFADLEVNGFLNLETGEFCNKIKEELDIALGNPLNVSLDFIEYKGVRYEPRCEIKSSALSVEVFDGFRNHFIRNCRG